MTKPFTPREPNLPTAGFAQARAALEAAEGADAEGGGEA
jgi:hypothetical protein